MSSTLTFLLLALQLDTTGAAPLVEAPGVSVGICELFVNGRSFGDVLVGFDDAGLLISARALADAGVRWSAAAERTVRGERLVSMASLSPAITARVDLADAAAYVTVRADALTATTRLGPAVERSVPLSRANNLFLNYAATATTSQRPSYAAELGATIANGFVRNTISRNGYGVVNRGSTTVSFDSPSRLMRLEAGDSTLAGDGFAGGAPVAGITLSREFAIDPLVLQYAPVSISGTTPLPGTAEVYVNGQLVSRTDVEPGAFELRSLPVPTGRGTVRVILRDAFGRAQELSSAYYRSPRVLDRGLHQFRYTLGMPRLDATRMFHYGGIAGAAQHRVGVTDALTVGGSVTFDGPTYQGGPEVAWRLPIGEFEVSARLSRDAGATVGHATAASYMLRGRWLTLTGSARGYSRTFEPPGRLPFQQRPRTETLASAAVAWSGLSIEGQYSRALSWYAEASNRWQISVARPLARRWTMSVTAFRTVTNLLGVPTDQLFVSLIRPLGNRTSLTSTWQATSDSHPERAMALDRSLSQGPGIGYSARWREGAPLDTAAFQVQGSAGRVELRHDIAQSGSTDRATLAGSLVFIGGHLHPARPLDDAFALVQVGDIRGVRAYASNQFVGQTGRHGDLVVPTLVSYTPNRVAIEDRDLPIQVDVSRTEALVRPGFRGAAIVSFDVRRARMIQGRLVVPGPGTIRPLANGDATVVWTLTDSEFVPLGPAGEFFFERATPGLHEVHVTLQGSEYHCPLTVQAHPSTGVVERAGDLACVLVVKNSVRSAGQDQQ